VNNLGINCIISPKAVIGDNVIIGNNVIIKDNVIIKSNSYIGDNCIIGEYIIKSPKEEAVIKCTTIGEGALIRSNSIIYTGTSIGENFSTGHFAIIREDTAIKNNCSVGSYSTVANEVVIGNGTKIHTGTLITDKSIIGENVRIFSHITTSSDKHPPCGLCDVGIKIGDNTVVGAATVFMPGIEIVSNVLIASGSYVNKNIFESGYLYGGNPIKKICLVDKIPCTKKIYKSAYPWYLRENL